MFTKIKSTFLTFLSQVSESPSMGIIYAILSTIFFSYNYFAAQEVIRLNKHFPALEIVLVRSAIQLVCVIPYIYVKRETILFERDKWSSLLQLSLVQYIVTIMGYIALNFISLSLMLPITATCPLFAILFSVIILKDKCFWLDAVCGLVAMVGVVFISRPTFLFGNHFGENEDTILKHPVFKNPDVNSTIGCTLALIFGAVKGIFFTLAKKWTIEEKTSVNVPVILYSSTLGVFTTPMIMLFRGHTFALTKTAYQTLSLFGSSVASLLGLIANLLAMKTQTPTVVGIIRNLDIFWGHMIQVVVFDIWPSVWTITGSVVIILTTAVVCFRGKFYELDCNENRKYSQLEAEND